MGACVACFSSSHAGHLVFCLKCGPHVDLGINHPLRLALCHDVFLRIYPRIQRPTTLERERAGGGECTDYLLRMGLPDSSDLYAWYLSIDDGSGGKNLSAPASPQTTEKQCAMCIWNACLTQARPSPQPLMFLTSLTTKCRSLKRTPKRDHIRLRTDLPNC